MRFSIKKMVKINIKNVPNIIFHLFFIPLIPIVVIVLPFLWIFRQIVKILLNLKLGNQFGGLVTSADRVYATKCKESLKIGITVSYIQINEPINLFEEMKAVVQNKIFNCPNDYPKLLATRHSYLGQEYYLKDQLTIDDILKPIPINQKEDFDDTYLQKFVSNIANSPFLKDNTALWEIFIATKPLPNKENKKIYPIVLRFHHIVGDGVRMIMFLSKMFSAEGIFESYLKTEYGKKKNSLMEDLIAISKDSIYLLYLLVVAPGLFVKRFLSMETMEANALNEKPLCGEKIMTWFSEEDCKYLSIVKNIKNRIPNTKFSDVTFTCISASIFNYFKKINLEPPKRIICAIPLLLGNPTKDLKGPIPLKNEITFGILDMPLVDPSRLLDGLESVKDSINALRKDPLIRIVYWFVNYLGAIIPQSILCFLLRGKGTTCSVTNVPGVSRLKGIKNSEVISSLGSGPNLDKSGLTLTIFTYDNKFHICLYVDKSVISKKEDAQFIINDFFRNINILNEESLRTFK